MAGCALGPDYERPPVMEPDHFRTQQEATLEEVSVADLGWWELFQDENLQFLIRKALLENKDLRMAVSRVREARAQLAVTGASQLPQFNGTASVQRNRTPGAVVQGQFSDELLENFGLDSFPSFAAQRDQYRASADLSFEIDLWGKTSPGDGSGSG